MIINGSPFLATWSNPHLAQNSCKNPGARREKNAPSHGINCQVTQISYSASLKLSFPIWRLEQPIPISPYPLAKHDVSRGGAVRIKWDHKLETTWRLSIQSHTIHHLKTPNGKSLPSPLSQISRFFSHLVNGSEKKKKNLGAWHHLGLRGRGEKDPSTALQGFIVWEDGTHTEHNCHHFGKHPLCWCHAEGVLCTWYFME